MQVKPFWTMAASNRFLSCVQYHMINKCMLTLELLCSICVHSDRQKQSLVAAANLATLITSLQLFSPVSFNVNKKVVFSCVSSTASVAFTRLLSLLTSSRQKRSVRNVCASQIFRMFEHTCSHILHFQGLYLVWTAVRFSLLTNCLPHFCIEMLHLLCEISCVHASCSSTEISCRSAVTHVAFPRLRCNWTCALNSVCSSNRSPHQLYCSLYLGSLVKCRFKWFVHKFLAAVNTTKRPLSCEFGPAYWDQAYL